MINFYSYYNNNTTTQENPFLYDIKRSMSDYKTLMIPFDDFFKDDNVVTLINGCISEMHYIATSCSQFISMYLLDCFNNCSDDPTNMPNLDHDLVNGVIKVLLTKNYTKVKERNLKITIKKDENKEDKFNKRYETTDVLNDYYNSHFCFYTDNNIKIYDFIDLNKPKPPKPATDNKNELDEYAKKLKNYNEKLIEIKESTKSDFIYAGVEIYRPFIDEFMTSIHNNIKANFCKNVCHFVNEMFSDYLEKCAALYEAQQDKLTEQNIKNTIDDKHNKYHTKFIYEHIKILKNDLLDGTNNILKIEQLDKIYGDVYNMVNNVVIKLSDEFKKKSLGKNIYDIKFIGEILYISFSLNKLLLSSSKKITQSLCMRNSSIDYFITITNDGLYNLLYAYNSNNNIVIKNRNNSKNESENENKIVLNEVSDLWGYYTKIYDKTPKSKNNVFNINGYKFNEQIKTNGYEICLSFISHSASVKKEELIAKLKNANIAKRNGTYKKSEKPEKPKDESKKEKTKKNKKQKEQLTNEMIMDKINKNEIIDIENILAIDEFNEYAKENADNMLFADPGLTSILTMTNQHGNIFKYSKNMRIAETKRNIYANQIEKNKKSTYIYVDGYKKIITRIIHKKMDLHRADLKNEQKKIIKNDIIDLEIQISSVLCKPVC